MMTSLVITGRYHVLMKVRSKALVQRIDLNTTHAEADGIIPQHVMALADVGCKTINVISDDTDVYVLLAHYIAVESLSVSLLMDPTSHRYRGKSGKALRHRSTIDCSSCSFQMRHSWLLPWYHVDKCFKALSAGIELNHLGNRKVSLDDVTKESTHCIRACYGQKSDPSDALS